MFRISSARSLAAKPSLSPHPGANPRPPAPYTRVPAPQPAPSPRRRPAPLERHTSLVRRKPLGGAPVVATPLVPASEAQRAKVAGLRCVVCERTPVDPAHIVPQRLGGCADPACVIPACRTHHRLYDRGELRLALYLADGWERELEHALLHASAETLARALDGGGWGKDAGSERAA
jgi:hypothetical protein